MGIFSSLKITNKHVDLLNTYLPEEIHLKDFELSQLEHLSYNIIVYVNKLKHSLKEKVEELKKLKEERLFDKYKLFNVPLKGKSLGLVDIGLVQRFNAKSTGNSFENGAIQHAIETSFEQSWANSNSQYNSVGMVKKELKHKAIELYPESNAIENFHISFRELGSSGNVFIYAYGTAIIAEYVDSNEIDDEIKALTQEIKSVNLVLEDAQNKLNELPSVKVLKTKLKELKTI